eukprot:CAMPEP_0196694086 /NCGR_PEP_ID=MMETSP1090-20130531/32633_1 /TAXON_ID=37098 /ORGANISM="Isochrysis sp, Strain CCMP1244" /LENGTH=71 /DNA_ID=CAMNT_0042033567 /DNA_START=80 /DNA_END=292 /DNA_ORIENTATION=-
MNALAIVADEGHVQRQYAGQEDGRGAILIKDGGRHGVLVLARELAQHHDVVGRRRARHDQADEPERVDGDI